MNNISSGIADYGKAISHISKNGLWGYILLPGILSVIIGAAVATTAWGLSDNFGELLVGFWKWEWGYDTVVKIAQFFGLFLMLAFGAIVYKQLLMVLLAPFMSLLSEKVENQLNGKPNRSNLSINKIFSDLIRGLRIAIRNIIREVSATIFLLIIGLIPVFTPFTTILIFLIQSYYAGFGNLDFTLERHKNYSDSVRFVKQNRGYAVGNGIVFMLLFLSVVGFLFALPLGTVAATIGANKRLDSPKNNDVMDFV